MPNYANIRRFRAYYGRFFNILRLFESSNATEKCPTMAIDAVKQAEMRISRFLFFLEVRL